MLFIVQAKFWKGMKNELPEVITGAETVVEDVAYVQEEDEIMQRGRPVKKKENVEEEKYTKETLAV